MKRSEMVNIIEQILRNNYPGGLDETRELADEILSGIEGNGMLPSGYVYWNRGKHGGIMPSGKNGDLVHAWESE